MAPPLVALPTELLDQILHDLALHDLSRLCLCCSALQQLVGPFLYQCILKREANRYQLSSMEWGTKLGNDATLTKAARYSAVGSHQYCSIDILLLVRQRRLESFKLLWDSNYWNPWARLPKQYGGPESWYEGFEKVSYMFFFKQACAPGSYDFMKHMLEHPCTSQHYHGQAIADIYLRNVVQRQDCPLSLVQHVLDHGASPNRHQATGEKRDEPVSLAISHGRLDIMQLLLSSGASIHGKRFGQGRDRILHIPIFAAATRMASHGSQLVLKCLDEGSMVNHTAQIINKGTPRLGTNTRHGAPVPLPIYAYLAAITDWDPHPVAPKIGPIDGVRFWLDHGVTVADNGIPIFDDDIPRMGHHKLPILSLVCFVLLQRGIRGLRNDNYFYFIKFLASLGSTHEQVLKLSKMYHDNYLRESSIVRERWSEVLLLLGCDKP
ncbi:F-box-like domain-containing protein [Microdochium nivale]|nr:F-box-like domain-containing protein [Microdochium nivale]